MTDSQLNWLCEVYVQFCTNHNLPQLSADEQDLSIMTDYQKHWITTFSSLWEDLSQ